MSIAINGTIVSNDDYFIYDWLGYEATSPKKIEEALAEANGADVTFTVNSGGGDVFAGNEINYLISQYKGKTTVDITGIAASIATVICCGADVVRMNPSSQYMIHNVSSGAYGDYNTMDKASEILKSANKSISNAYRLKTGMSDEELLAMMNKESWMDAEEALKYGFIDEIIGDEKGLFANKLYNSNQFATILPEEVKDRVRMQLQNEKETKRQLFVAKNKILIERMRGEKL